MILLFIWKDDIYFNANYLAYQVSSRKRPSIWLQSILGVKAINELTVVNETSSSLMDGHHLKRLENEQLFKRDHRHSLWFHKDLMPYFCNWLDARVAESFSKAMSLKPLETCGTLRIAVEGLEREKHSNPNSSRLEKVEDAHTFKSNINCSSKRRNEDGFSSYPADKVKRHISNVDPNPNVHKTSIPSSIIGFPLSSSENRWPPILPAPPFYSHMPPPRDRYRIHSPALLNSRANYQPLPIQRTQYVYLSRYPPINTYHKPEGRMFQESTITTSKTPEYSYEFIKKKEQELKRAKEVLKLEQNKLDVMKKSGSE